MCVPTYQQFRLISLLLPPLISWLGTCLHSGFQGTDLCILAQNQKQEAEDPVSEKCKIPYWLGMSVLFLFELYYLPDKPHSLQGRL